MYKDLKILILGGARSGIASAKLLYKDNDVTLCDMKELPESDRGELESLGVKIIVTKNQVDIIDSSWDLIVKNPAIMYVSEVYQKCLSLNLKVINEMELAYHYLPENVKIIGVTGSNGKTTTTSLIYELIKNCGKKVYLGGNIGTALSSFVEDIKSDSILLLEISDHQLVDMHEFKCDISVLTNICPTHLDYHGSYEHYMMSKKGIFNNQKENDVAIINYKNEDAMTVSKDINVNKKYFGDNLNYYTSDGIYINNEKVISLSDIKIKGEHNYENILAALLVMKEINFNLDTVKDVLSNFKGVEHRLEYVCDYNGVTFYNDSKATNPKATLTALKTFNKDVRLILGGQERFQDFNELNEAMGCVKKIYTIGTTAKRTYEYALERGIDATECGTLSKAMEAIHKDLEAGDTVLLSTASASQDFYAKFEDRGNEFKDIIKSWQS